MKRKGIWKKWLCMALAAGMLAALPGTAFSEREDGTKVEWTYDNSILVHVEADESRNFLPEDFPGINCSSVCTVGKSVTAQGILYELILTLNNKNAEEMDKAVHILSQSENVKAVQRNEKFAPPKSVISLDRSVIYLKKGDTAKLSVQKVNLV